MATTEALYSVQKLLNDKIEELTNIQAHSVRSLHYQNSFPNVGTKVDTVYGSMVTAYNTLSQIVDDLNNEGTRILRVEVYNNVIQSVSDTV